MARRTLIWHIGLAATPQPVLDANLQAHRPALSEAGVEVAATSGQAALATHELLGTHREAGLSRVEVDGQWARLCDRVWKHKGVSVLSTPDVCAADKDRLRFALDQLIGVEVHVVVTVGTFSEQLYGGWLAELRAGRTTGWEKYVGRVTAEPREHAQAERFWAGHDLVQVLSRWGWTFRPERLHVIGPGDAQTQWAALLDVAGLDPERAQAMPAVVPPYADPAGVAVLRKVNRQLDDPLVAATYLTGGGQSERAAMPVVATPTLVPLAARWSAELAEAGHDLRGSLAGLAGTGEGLPLPGPRDQLGTAVDALADALAENARLRRLLAVAEADRDRLDHKRRKLKRRLQAAAEN